MTRLHGAIAASVTPLKDGGRTLDTMAFAPLTAFLAEGGVDGVLACGTTGEGMLLSVAERRTATELFLDNRPAGFQVAVHAGAQTTADTVALAAHAVDVGADAVAVIAPPYFPLDDEELLRHLRSAANAADPLAFYVYEFAGRSGYAIPPARGGAPAGRGAERGRHEGLGLAVRGGARRTWGSGSTCSSGRSRWRSRGWRPARSGA